MDGLAAAPRLAGAAIVATPDAEHAGSLESHLAVLAAERARLAGTVEPVRPA